MDYVGITNKFWSAYHDIREQKWSAPHDVVHQDLFSRVLLFQPKNPNGQAVLLNPPRAGHHSNIAEPLTVLLSEMGYAVYVIDHLPATEKTADYGLDNVYDEVDIAYSVLTFGPGYSKVHLVGLCQGGWALAIWAAINPDAGYDSLIIAGTPIDFKVDGGIVQNLLALTSDGYIDNIINHNGGLWPGRYQLDGFKALNPADRYIGTLIELQNAVMSGDESKVEKWIRNNSWYETVHDLPGRLIRQISRQLFRENQLVAGELKVHGILVDLGNITCSVVAITGEDDHITLKRQCTALLNHISSLDKSHHSIPECGHVGIYLKKTSLSVWRKVMEGLS